MVCAPHPHHLQALPPVCIVLVIDDGTEDKALDMKTDVSREPLIWTREMRL